MMKIILYHRSPHKMINLLMAMEKISMIMVEDFLPN